MMHEHQDYEEVIWTRKSMMEKLGLRPADEFAASVIAANLEAFHQGHMTIEEALVRRTGRTIQMVIGALLEVAEGHPVLISAVNRMDDNYIRTLARDWAERLGLCRDLILDRTPKFFSDVE